MENAGIQLLKHLDGDNTNLWYVKFSHPKQGVRTAGVVCVLGIGFSFGSFLLYKLYHRILHPVSNKSITKNEEDQESADECEICLDTLDGSESKGRERKEEMGNTHSKRDGLPAYYSRGGGVEFGQRSRNNMSVSSMPFHEYIQLRQTKPIERLKRHSAEIIDDNHNDDNEEQASLVSHSDSSDFDSDNENEGRSLSPTIGLEVGLVSDDGFPVSNSIKRHASLTPSMKGNFSPSSLYEKNMRFSDNEYLDKDLSKSKSEKYLPLVPNDPDLAQSSVLLTPPSDDDMQLGPGDVSKFNFRNGTSEQTSNLHNSIDSNEQNHTKKVYDNRYGFSDSVENDSFGKMKSGDKCDRDDYINTEMLIAKLNSPERESRQNLFHRLHEFAFNLSGTASTTSSNISTPEHDGCDSDSGTPDAELFDSENLDESAISNFGMIETEIQSIENEFTYLSSKLEELKNSCTDEADDFSDFEHTQSQPLSRRVCQIVQRSKTVRESSPSLIENCGNSDTMESIDCEEGSSEERRGGSSGLGKSNNTGGAKWTDNVNTVNGHSNTDYVVKDQPLDELEVDCAGQDTFKIDSIGAKEEILAYAGRQRWGHTKKADIMIEAYSKIPDLLHCDHLHSIRGDNYCFIRSSLYQIFVNGIHLDHKLPSIDQVLETLHTLYNDQSSGLRRWDFTRRIQYQTEDKLPMMKTCLSTLFTRLSEIQSLSSYEERELWTINCLNSDPDCELQMLEAVKLLMFMDSVQLYQDLQTMANVPVFAWLIFARETSTDPSLFIKNHLNELGNSAGIEQVEMFLLGHALGIVIRVVRLQQLKHDDFVSYYPDEINEDWPQINLIADDDRHYNAPVP